MSPPSSYALLARAPPIGAVEGALGQRWFDATVTGQDAHAGPTPLPMRRDALLAAARMVQMVRTIAAEAPDYARGTVGQLFVHPNSRNVIPGRVEFTVDLRKGEPIGWPRGENEAYIFTAGNAPGLNDGGAALVLMSAARDRILPSA